MNVLIALFFPLSVKALCAGGSLAEFLLCGNYLTQS